MCGCAWSATDASPRSCRPAPSPSTNGTNTDPRRPRTVHQSNSNNTGIIGGRNAGADALGREPDPAEWLFFLDNDAPLPPHRRVLARLIAQAQQHPGPHTYSPDWPARTT
ncbi:hypothetical protein TPA0910_12390 [Streptomyces hygroscopicus subsp. sporocinereus]|uniref:Glycosyltransferase 2-like domain-containing protein n=1 Tax=Streptomyces hygroscopicus TaxID=1912 RepID=A0ABQ3TU05_STRHY|nr:hypothetical protein TPA0910_12390 [Streptomyces hygroscopicus]